MAVAELGVELVDGDPGALRDAARALRGVGEDLAGVAGGLTDGLVCDWRGSAAVQFEEATLTQADAARRGSEAMSLAADALHGLADDLEAAIRAGERQLDHAREAERRRVRADRERSAATERARALRSQQAAAATEASMTEATGLPAAHLRAAEQQHARFAATAEQDAAAQARAGERAAGDLEEARRDARRTADRYEQNAQHVAHRLAGLADQAPVVRVIGGTPVAAVGGPGRPPLVPPVIVSATPAHRSSDEHDGDNGPLGWIRQQAAGAWGSLKRSYGPISSGGHLLLDVAGLIPVLGEPADGVNAVWYAAEGNDVDAGLSAAGMVPVVGWGATAGKWTERGVEAAGDIKRASGRGGDASNPAGVQSDSWGRELPEFPDPRRARRELSRDLASVGTTAEERAKIVGAFEKDSITRRVLAEDEYGMRTYGGEAAAVGRWLAPTLPISRSGHALPAGNTGEALAQVRIPAGTVVYEGRVAPLAGQPGGLRQIYVPRPHMLERVR